MQQVSFQPLEPFNDLRLMDMNIFLGTGLMDGKSSVPPEDSPPPPLLTNECLDSLAIEYLDASVAETVDSLVAQTRARILREEADHNDLHAAAVLNPSLAAFGVRISSTKNDMSFFDASTGLVNRFLIRETVKQQGARLTVALLPYIGYWEANGRKAPVPQRGVTHAAVPFDSFHIDLCGPLKPALNGSIYMVMFVDSASRWQRAYGMRAKSDTNKYVKRFLVDMKDMGTPRCLWMDGGGKLTGREFAEFCNAVSIRREYTALGTPIQNGVVESAIWRTFKGGYAACRHIFSIPHVDLSTISNTEPYDHSLWLASVIWGSGCFNRSATKANRGWLPPYEIFLGRKPPLEVVPFFQERMMRVKRTFKSDVQSVKCFHPHGANNHSTSSNPSPSYHTHLSPQR